MPHGRKIAVIGSGYVGLPVAAAFARAGSPVIGFDIDAERIRELRAGIDTLEPADAVILAVAHDAYVEGGWHLVRRLLNEGEGLVLDVKMKLDRGAKPPTIELWRH
jgi:UDP-N-acetyl-D-mannosaminuronate dehydrogenase